MAVLPSFHSSATEALKKIHKGSFASSSERDQLIETVLTAGETFRAKDVMWMLFRPDRAVRDAGVELLQAHREPQTFDVFVAASKGMPEAALRTAGGAFFSLGIPGFEKRLEELAEDKKKDSSEAVRQIILGAPASPALAPLVWRLAMTGSLRDRLQLLDRLAAYQFSETNIQRWQHLARSEEKEIREKALVVLAKEAPEASLDLIVQELPRADYGVQQHLIEALSRLATGSDVEFADRILPLMASGDASTRLAVIKILVSMKNRPEMVHRYLGFSKTLAGWARDRALESMKEFGDDILEPAIELLSGSDLDVRAAALAVVGSFNDPRVVNGVVPLLKDPDWWIRVSAADTLGRLKDPRAVKPLTNALADEETRWAAVEALGRIGHASALPVLGGLLKDPAPEIRIEVLLAFRNFNHPKILAALQQVAANDEDRFVRGRALEIAEEVAARSNTEIPEAERLRAAALQARVGQGEPRLHALLVGSRNQKASDLHVAVGQPPMVRLATDLFKVKGEPFTAEDTTSMLREILTDDQWQRLETEQQLDLCYYIPRAGRYRGNVFYDHHGLNAVFRVIPEQPPTIAEIGLPSWLAEIAEFHQGLVVVCGPAGSGKSTTLAALVNLINETRHDHVITMEDPVEFVHPFKNCLINQREVGSHTASFARALRAALREDPDVIVIGDLRDNESVSLALTAAETGHIVIGTLNSTTAGRAVDRLISSFPFDEQPQVRTSLAESLKYIIAQRLIPAVGDRRRVACFEVLKGTMSAAAMIRDEKTYQLPSAMQLGKGRGMQTFDDALMKLVETDQISPEEAYLHAESKTAFEPLVSEEFLESQTFL
jgi:twitching motility protein PilT